MQHRELTDEQLALQTELREYFAAMLTPEIRKELEAVRGATGLAVLPCALADEHPELRRVLDDGEHVQRGLWLLFHRDVRRATRVRAVVDRLVDYVVPRLGTQRGRAR